MSCVLSGDVHVIKEMSKRKYSEVSTKEKIAMLKRKKSGLATKQDLTQYVKKSSIENKHYYRTFTTTAYPIAGSVGTAWNNAIGDAFFFPAVGGEFNQRVGRTVKVFKIQVRGMIDVPPDTTATVGTTPFIRILLASAKENNGQTLDLNTFMTANGVFAWRNPDHFGSFDVWKDFIIEFPSLATSANPVGGAVNTEGYTMPFKITKKFKNGIDVRFTSGNSQAITAVNTNAFFVASMASNVSYNPRLTYTTNVSYKDL